MANEIRDLFNRVPKAKADWKLDWKDTGTKADWKNDFGTDLASAPVNTVAPAITGTATVGQTLTVTNGTWTGTGITYTRQWFASGVAIVGATGLTYVLTAAEVDKTINVEVRAVNTAGAVEILSNTTAAVAAA